MRRTMATTFTLIALSGSAAGAEEMAGPALAEGARVRVRIEGARKDDGVLTGRLLRADDASLTVLPDGGRDPVLVEHSRVERLEVSRGRKRRTLQGLACGAILGAGVVAVTATLPEARCTGFTPECLGVASAELARQLTGALVAAALVVGGTIIGAAVKEDRWQRVEEPRSRIGLGVGLTAAPGGKGVGAALRVTF